MSEQFRRNQPTIPVPSEDVRSLHSTAAATKELVEQIAGQRGAVGDAAVTFDDLVRLGLIARDKIPRKLG